MDDFRIFRKLNDPQTQKIYGYSTGEPWINTSHGYRKDEIIEIKMEDLELTQIGGMVLQRGWPWPESIYWFSDYGRTWAFTEEEILPAEPPDGRIYE